MPRSEFVHLHLHSQFSLLDGACRIPDILNIAKEYKMDSLAITDHGNLFGAIEFYTSAQKAGIKPIIGCEVYIAAASRLEKSAGGIEEAAYHFILLAKDETGYQNLMKLVSAGYLEGFYYRPRIDKQILQEHSQGLIGLSACLKGEIPFFLQQGRFNEALKAADDFLHILGRDNFYLELQENLIPEQKVVNEGLMKISRELNIPLVATNDVHYLRKEQAASHEVLLCIQTQTTLEDPNRMRFQTDEFYFKSPAEMQQAFSYAPQAVANTLEIARRCNLELDFSQVHLPRYEPPSGENKEEFLRGLCRQGLREKLPQPRGEINERLEHELKVIKDMGFISYFLIVWDFIHYAKENHIPVGPGRGSAAGSLVSYLLGITDINPLRYGLLFERFLNPQRIGLPDIDIDFCYERRQEVIEYVTRKYGRENVAQIITFGTMQARAVVRDVGRVMGMSYGDVDRIAKMIPPDPNIRLKEAVETEEELGNLYKKDPQINRLINTAVALEGLNRHASVHAAGVVIADKPLNEYMPLFKTQDEQVTSGFSMGILEKIGLLKVDFLGLRTLTVIESTLGIIRRTQKKEINIHEISLDDPQTYRLLCSAQTIGVFQIESSGMRDLLRKLEPQRFEDLIALLALYRPGPIGSGMLEDFIQRRHNRVPIRYDHKKLEGILKETYGIIVYQEQIMQIASALAGFSLAQADLLRRAMSKKIPEVMEEQRKNFLLGCLKNGVNESTANKIFDLIEYFSGYGFNKCVVGSTKVINAQDGTGITVKELFVQKDNLPYTFGCSEDLKIRKAKIKDVVQNGIRPVYRLTTFLGREIVATANHPFLVFQGWKELADLSIGERIALPRNIPIASQSRWEDFQIIVLAGILSSRGNTSYPERAYFSNDNKAAAADFAESLSKFERTLPRIRQTKGRFEVCASRGDQLKFFKGNESGRIALAECERTGAEDWLISLGLDGKEAQEKFIPTEVFSLSSGKLALFLGRLWSGGGVVWAKNNPEVFYATESLRLAEQLQELLLRFGIASRLNSSSFRYQGGYTVHLFGSEAVRIFQERISPFIIGRDRQCRLLKGYCLRQGSKLGLGDTLSDEVSEIIRQEKERSGLTWNEIAKRSGVALRRLYGRARLFKKGFPRQTIEQLAHFFESERLLRLVNAEIIWDRVKQVEFLGREQTYDLEVEGIHNFIANGIIVHNSHSAAYALISYQTAYLKANFPLEFMSALLTSERDNTDKLVEYIAEANRIGIKVLPPDINESGAFFEVVGPQSIRFGLLAVKNVGQGAVESIIKAREKKRFSSLDELCGSIDLRLVNKKVLESLIKCGAMDSFHLTRAQMVAGLDRMLQYSSRLQREKSAGQISFFDKDLAEHAFKDACLELPRVKEWPEPQLLAFEKEILGFYVSGHPLARYAGELRLFNSASTANLTRNKDVEEIKIVGLISKVKQTTTRVKQERMAIFKLEDLEGEVEALVFPAAFQKVYRYLLPGTVALVRGRLNLREEIPKIIVNDLIPMEEVYKLITALNIDLCGVRENLFESLKKLLSSSPGTVPIYLHLNTAQKSRVQLVVGNGLFVQPSETLIKEVENLLGQGRLSLTL